ncbi:MAG TPA: ubiquinol-cytochrome c reductase iron-sulfur subunit [Ktedonobacterales bacterium]|nr:ubiquinol-cytochrome c reductase iron-sulfur subunit [Ktedonobacterales bacterium]
MANSPDSTDKTPAGAAPSDAVEEQRVSPLERLETRPTRLIGARARQQWREEFPYHWSADDLVTRRDTLRFLVAGSGALFLASAGLATVGALRTAAAQRLVPIARVGEVAVNSSKVFNYPDEFAQGILVNLPGKGLVAYSDVCTHLSCAVFYQRGTQQFHCPCHEGYFDAFSGNVLAGPPTRPLPIIEIAVQGDTVYAIREVER